MAEYKSKYKSDWSHAGLEDFRWGPHVVSSTVSDELINLLIEKGKEVRKPEFDWSYDLAGKLKEEYTYNNVEGDHWNEWFVPLFHEHIEHYIKTLGPGRSKHIVANAKNFKWDLTRLWINYQKAGEYNPPHNHSGDLSFVLYPDIPQEMLDEAKNIDLRRSNKTAPGSICFDYGERKFGDFLSFCNTSFSMVPQTGLLIIFPAYLTHHAYAFQTKDVERVSVSGNIIFTWEKNEEGVPL